MQFKLPLIATLFAASTMASPVPSSEASCAVNVVSAINGLTAQVTSLQTDIAANSNLVSLANDIINGFEANIFTLLAGVSLPCDSTMTQQDQEDICNAAKSFISEDTTLVHTLTQKRGVLAGSIWLHAVEGAINGLAGATTAFMAPVVDNAPVCGGSIKTELQALESAINQAVGAY